MGVYIKGMEMPKNCHECRLYEGDIYYCSAADKKIDILDSSEGKCQFCPLTPVPPHGRLIEKNAVFELIQSMPSVDKLLPVEFMKALQEIPTVIPASGEDK